jgi:hypothetical protein
MTDEDRINWLEQHHTLHFTVEVLYVVIGYQAQLLYDDEPITVASGETYREALDALIAKCD